MILQLTQDARNVANGPSAPQHMLGYSGMPVLLERCAAGGCQAVWDKCAESTSGRRVRLVR